MRVFQHVAALFAALLLVQVSEGGLFCDWFGIWCGLTLKVSGIGSDWVYLSWDEGSVKVKCHDRPFFPISNSTLECIYIDITWEVRKFSKELSYNITSTGLRLATNVTYSCWVEAQSEVDQTCRKCSHVVSFTPGAGDVVGIPENHVVYVNFTDELNASVITLNCTVEDEYMNMQTETIWTVDNYKGRTILHKDISTFQEFNVHGESHQAQSSSYKNLLNISTESMKDLNGTTIHCGSHMNRYQAKFEFLTCEVPPKLVKDILTVWEGTTGCTIRVTSSTLKANKMMWWKNGMVVPVNSFETITFDEIQKEDAGTYVGKVKFSKGIDSRQFEFSFTLDVLYGPRMDAGHKKCSVYIGDSVTLICGTSLTSNPKATVTWTNPQGGSIQDCGSSRYVISEGPNVSLTINNVTESDGGIWKCTIKVNASDVSVACPDPNMSSRTRCVEVEVIVIVPPSEPRNVRGVAVDDTHILVTWDRPKQPGSALTGYKLCFNGTCDVNVGEQSFEVSVPHFKQNKCYKVTVYAVSESDGVPLKGPCSEHVWIGKGNAACTFVLCPLCLCSAHHQAHKPALPLLTCAWLLKVEIVP